VSPSGVSKKAAGDYLHYYREVRGLEYTELALANVYGPRQSPAGEAGVVASFAAQMLAGRRPNIYGDGTATRDFLYVDDAVDAFVRATERGGGLLMNIGTGTETSVRDLYDAIARLQLPGPPPGPAPLGELGRSCRPRRCPPRRDPGPLDEPRPHRRLVILLISSLPAGLLAHPRAATARARPPVLCRPERGGRGGVRRPRLRPRTARVVVGGGVPQR
jgi:nucleoside-diphosphate-sugar epimerase